MVSSNKESAEVASPGKRKEVIRRLFGERETGPIVERPVVPEIPKEVEQAQPVPGAATQLPGPVTDDQTGQVLVTDPGQSVQINLPLNDDQIQQGLTYQVTYSIRWLAEWCIRMIKMVGGTFKKDRKRKKRNNGCK